MQYLIEEQLSQKNMKSLSTLSIACICGYFCLFPESAWLMAPSFSQSLCIAFSWSYKEKYSISAQKTQESIRYGILNPQLKTQFHFHGYSPIWELTISAELLCTATIGLGTAPKVTCLSSCVIEMIVNWCLFSLSLNSVCTSEGANLQHITVLVAIVV